MTDSREQARDSGKRQYSAPQLISYGSVAKLTQNTGSVSGDSGPLSMSTGCL
jgi:hypothetical protein